MGNNVQKIIATTLVRNSNGEILLQRRVDPLFPEADGKWEFLGGTVQFGESVGVAAVRECMEEVGCKVQIERLLPQIQTRVWVSTQNEQSQVFVVCFETKLIEGEPRPLDKKVSEVQWVKKEDIFQLDLLPGIEEFINLTNNV